MKNSYKSVIRQAKGKKGLRRSFMKEDLEQSELEQMLPFIGQQGNTNQNRSQIPPPGQCDRKAIRDGENVDSHTMKWHQTTIARNFLVNHKETQTFHSW